MSELYHFDDKVLTLKEEGGVPRVLKVDTPELLPICLRNDCTDENLRKWLSKRSIPEKREGLADMREEFGSSWNEAKNSATLMDHYWIRQRTETWKKVNFFSNMYSTDIGDMAFTPWDVQQKRINNNSPDLTTGGVLKKRWKQYPDRRSYLIKAGSIAARQEPLSEVLVSVLCEKLKIIPFVKYNLCVEGTIMCSVCDNFVSDAVDLVPAYEIFHREPRGGDESTYNHLLRMCELFDIPDAEEFLEAMIFIDNLTANEDRNLGNIGFLRDSKTMQFIGPAPLYDSGNAYWSTKKVNDKIKSVFFGDVEADIVAKWKKKCNLSVLKNYTGYKKLIENYPCINDAKKEILIEEIGKRNNHLVMEHKNEMSR